MSDVSIQVSMDKKKKNPLFVSIFFFFKKGNLDSEERIWYLALSIFKDQRIIFIYP